jgi:RND family efflux transporter MFP subunit
MPEKMNQDLQSLRIDRGRKSGAGRSRKRMILAVAVLGFLAVIALVAFRPDLVRMPGFGEEPPVVELAVAERTALSSTDAVLTASGYIVPRRRVEVSSKTSGRVEELLVDRGDIVKAGQVLARLDDKEILAQLKQARAARQAAAARLDEAVAGSRPQEIERAQAALDEAQANLRTAQINLDRALRLQERGVLAKQALDEARNAFDVAGAQVGVAKKNFELTQLGPRAEQVQLARAQLAEADASIVFLETQLENTIIRAPVAGTVLERLIEKGEMVTTGYVSGRGAKSALVSIADLKELEVELDINEADIPRVRLGQECSVSPESYPDRRYRAKVREIAPEANRQKATIQVKVAIGDPDMYLRPETNAKVNFLETANPQPAGRGIRVTVPKAAIAPGPSLFLFKNGKAVRTAITLGAERNGRVEVLSGLSGGEQVIVGKLDGIADNMSVTARK